MYRLGFLTLFSFLLVAGANGAAIQIGGASGITSNYILQGSGAACAAGAGNCVTGSTAGWAERNYDNILFAGATNSVGASPTPFTGYTQTGGTPSGLTASDQFGQTFAMLSDGVSSNNSSVNYWASTNTNQVPDSIVIPIGINGVSDLAIMMNNQWGSVGGNDTTVTFNFGTSSNDTSGDLTHVTVALNDTNNTGSNGNMRASMACTTVTTTTCNSSTNPFGTLQQGNLINGVTVSSGVVYSTFNYTSAGGFYTGSQGKLKLDDIKFNFNGAFSNLYLVSLTVTENISNTPSSVGTTGNPPSETAVSAITVDTVPEPGTVLLLLTGIGGVGLMRLRRKA